MLCRYSYCGSRYLLHACSDCVHVGQNKWRGSRVFWLHELAKSQTKRIFSLSYLCGFQGFDILGFHLFRVRIFFKRKESNNVYCIFGM